MSAKKECNSTLVVQKDGGQNATELYQAGRFTMDQMFIIFERLTVRKSSNAMLYRRLSQVNVSLEFLFLSDGINILFHILMF